MLRGSWASGVESATGRRHRNTGAPIGEISNRAVAPHDVFHAVLQLELALLQLVLFELFLIGEVRGGGQCGQTDVQVVMRGGEGTKLFVSLQQMLPQAL